MKYKIVYWFSIVHGCGYLGSRSLVYPNGEKIGIHQKNIQESPNPGWLRLSPEGKEFGSSDRKYFHPKKF